MELNGMEWNEKERNKMESTRVERNGMEWNLKGKINYMYYMHNLIDKK